jgi:hypothetical protein
VQFTVTFYKTAAICAALSAVTTLGVHLLPKLYPTPETFEQQLLLPTNVIYRFGLWVVFLHILLVWISMVGLGATRVQKSAGSVAIGMLGYLLFGFSELLRTSLVMFAVNFWRAQYRLETSETARTALRTLLSGWPQWNYQLFFLLMLGFLIGNVCYGISLWRGCRIERIVSGALFVWALLSAAVILLNYMGQAWLGFMPEWTNWTYQPGVRLLVGIWLWRFARVQAAEPLPAVLVR